MGRVSRISSTPATVVPAVVSVLMAPRLRIGWWQRGEMAQGLHTHSGPGFFFFTIAFPSPPHSVSGRGWHLHGRGLASGTLGERAVLAPHSCGPAFVSAYVVSRPRPGLMYLPVTGYLMDHWANGFSVNWSFNKWTIYQMDFQQIKPESPFRRPAQKIK